MILGPPELVLDGLGQLTSRRGVEDILEAPFEGAPRVGDVTGKMRQTGLVRVGMTLLGDIAVGTSDLGPVSIHYLAHHHRPARRRALMHHRFGGAEKPMVGVASLDPNAGLVGRHHRGLAQLGRDPKASGRTDHRHPAVTLDHRRNRRQVDLVVLADHFADQGRGQASSTARALIPIVILSAVEIPAQAPAMAVVSRCGVAGP